MKPGQVGRRDVHGCEAGNQGPRRCRERRMPRRAAKLSRGDARDAASRSETAKKTRWVPRRNRVTTERGLTPLLHKVTTWGPDYWNVCRTVCCLRRRRPGIRENVTSVHGFVFICQLVSLLFVRRDCRPQETMRVVSCKSLSKFITGRYNVVASRLAANNLLRMLQLIRLLL